MIKSTRNQLEYTKILADQAKLNYSDLDRLHKDWWWNYTDPHNLRLSRKGFEFVTTNKIPHYDIQLPELLKNRTLIQMSRLLTCPYFIKKLDLVYLLGEEESVLLKLHADNLQQYLDNLQL